MLCQKKLLPIQPYATEGVDAVKYLNVIYRCWFDGYIAYLANRYVGEVVWIYVWCLRKLTYKRQTAEVPGGSVRKFTSMKLSYRGTLMWATFQHFDVFYRSFEIFTLGEAQEVIRLVLVNRDSRNVEKYECSAGIVESPEQSIEE